MKRLATIAAAGTLLTFLLPLQQAHAHGGNGVTTVGNRLEGENYSTADSSCDPDFDNEHTVSTGDAAQMPHSGCGINYGTVTFQYPGSFGSFRADTWSGTGETVTSRLDIVVDGSVAASGSITRAPGSGYATVNFTSASAITAGSHTLRVQFTTTTGPSWTNFKFEGADISTVMTQVGSKTTGTGCTQPASSTNYDIRDTTISHWISYHVAASPMDVRRVWVWDDTGQTWIDDVRTHNVGTGNWCASMDQAINGTLFQPRPGNWHIETYFKSVSAQWVRVAPNLNFVVWPKLTTGGVYKNTVGDTTSFTSNDTVRVSTTWSTTNAISHNVRYHWYRPGGTEHAAGSTLSLPSGQSSYTVQDSLNLLTTGASAYPGTWTVKTWVDSDTNYMDKGTFTFTVTAAPVAPANDNFANRFTISSVPYSTSQSTANATLESGEPQPCGTIGSTVWYRYTPTLSGTVTAHTSGSNYDTVLAAYTGASLTALTNRACNDDFSGTTSQVSFAVTAGTTYWLQVGGYNGATGTVSLNVSQVNANQSPTACVNTPSVSGRTVSVSSCSTDPDGDALTYDWNWGDGSAHSTTSSASHTYACPGGTFTVTLTVNDGRGGTSTTTRSVTTAEPDSDGDGLKNCVETGTYGTSPTVADSDADGSNDGAEVTYWGADWNTDIDADGAHPGTCTANTGSNLCDGDSDRDGLNDGLEINHPAATFGTNATYWPNPRSRDIYVEVDYMVKPDEKYTCYVFFTCTRVGYSMKPTTAQLQKVRDAFTAQGIRVVFDNGEMGGGGLVSYRKNLRFDDGGAGLVDFQDYKRGGDGITASFDVANRYRVFHYLVVGYNYNSSPNSSGVAWGTDDDFFVSYGLIKDDGGGGFGYTDFDTAIAGTIIHELGHNLCLVNSSVTTSCTYEGIDASGHPAYDSSMNYDYQMTQVDYSTGAAGAPGDHNDWAGILLDSPLTGGYEPSHGASAGVSPNARKGLSRDPEVPLQIG